MQNLKRELGLFDVINLVVGTIVGADIYIAAAFGAGYLGPSSIFAWLIAGVMAITIALCFAECSSLLQEWEVPMHMLKRCSKFHRIYGGMGSFNSIMECYCSFSPGFCCLSIIFLSFHASMDADTD
jgi:hypothetical protein